jgi:hypothetical protein
LSCETLYALAASRGREVMRRKLNQSPLSAYEVEALTFVFEPHVESGWRVLSAFFVCIAKNARTGAHRTIRRLTRIRGVE